MRSSAKEAVLTVLLFEISGFIMFFQGYSISPMGVSGKMPYSGISLFISITWVVIVWVLAVITGAERARGVLAGYCIVITMCALYVPLYFYYAPIASIGKFISDTFSYSNFFMIIFIYTLTNFSMFALGWIIGPEANTLPANDKPYKKGKTMLNQWPYITKAERTGSTENDVRSLLTANGKEKVLEHCLAVAVTASSLAERFMLDPKLARTAAILHDVSAVIKPEDMLDYARKSGWELDKCEWWYPFILHQRVSAMIAREYFGIVDASILSAVECHTTLRANPSDYDMIIFLADKLSWDQEGVPPFRDILLSALDVSLEHASLAYINYALDNGMLLHPHKWLIEAKAWLEANI